VPSIGGTHEPEFSEASGKCIGYVHHDIYVIRDELVARRPEVHRHAANDDGMDPEGSRDCLNHCHDLKRTFG
jgi:hypothetical protein